MSDWRLLIEETVCTPAGRRERLAVLEGPTYPCRFYVGPYFAGSNLSPRLNETRYYHRTEDEAMRALIDMVEAHKR